MAKDLQKQDQKISRYLTESEILQYLNAETEEDEQTTYFSESEQEDPEIDNSDDDPDYIVTNSSSDEEEISRRVEDYSVFCRIL